MTEERRVELRSWLDEAMRDLSGRRGWKESSLLGGRMKSVDGLMAVVGTSTVRALKYSICSLLMRRIFRRCLAHPLF